MRIAALVALAALVLGGCQPRHLAFSPRAAALRRIAIVPPDVTLVRIVFSGDDEPLAAESDVARRALPPAIARQLAAHGFVVRPSGLDDAAEPVDQAVRYQATIALARYQTLVSDLLQGRRAGSLGPDVGRLADHADVDALLFVSLVGMTKSGGQVTRDVTVTVLTLGGLVYKTSATRLVVALVDGTTGQPLWWSSRLTDTLAFEGAPLESLVHDAFEPMPNLPPAGTPAPVEEPSPDQTP
jgi:hypothetical protein